MRKTLAWLAFITPCACGGRTLGDWPEQASGEGGSASGVASGGFVPRAGSGGVSTASGGRSSGGSTNLSGAPASGGIAVGGLAGGGLASGGLASGGYASGGYASGGYASGGYAGAGAASGGSGGDESCFEATQPEKGMCIHVRLCSAAQYETLCLMDTPTSAVCFCYVNGEVKSAKSILSATSETLCAPAMAAACP